MKSRRILSLLIAFSVMLTMLSVSAGALDLQASADWLGAMNFNCANNQVTDTLSMTSANMSEVKWAYALNDSVINGGAYYAGTPVIADGYLYATGGGKLHKVDIATGEGTIINDSAGSTVSYYDYLCYADGILILATQTSLEAYDMDGTYLGGTEGTYGYYHPVQYHNGYVICNGFIYKLDTTGDNPLFTQIGTSAIGGDTFNWSGGAFVNDLFYVASKTTVYAVDYTQNTVVDSYAFDPDRTATSNVQGGVAYDAETGRLYWATYTYNNDIHSIAISSSDDETKGKFVSDSYISSDAGQKSVATPIIYNGRVYLAGQQGRICVLSASDLTKVYDYVTLGGGKVQGTPILSVADGTVRIYAQCFNGHLYMFTDEGDSGSAVKLAETANYTEVRYPYGGYEQYSMDNSGNIYCYNESGYLFCIGVSKCEIPTITTDLSTDRVKYAINAEAAALTVEAEVSENAGELSYTWQMSEDKSAWSDIEGALENSYTPSTGTAGTTYYRCIITNTHEGNTASVVSSEAHILVKELSADTALSVMVSNSNSLTGGVRTEGDLAQDGVIYILSRTDKVTNIWLGVADEGTVTELDIIQGAGTAAPKAYKVTNSDIYTTRYYKNSYSLPIVAKAAITAEDGITQTDRYIVVSSAEAEKYVTYASVTSQSEYFVEGTGIAFTEAEQTAQLAINADSTIGNGELQSISWQWTSSDPTVAVVDENGLVTSIGGGEAVISASYEKLSVSVNVTSTATAHSTHTYAEGVCTICGISEPDSVAAYITIIEPNNTHAISKDGETRLNKHELSVGDIDLDGTVTINDAFIKVHTDHSANGASDFTTEESSYGLFITKFWGEQNSSVAYVLNNAFASSLTTELKRNDVICAYFYDDTVNWSDIYTYIDGKTTISVNNDIAYTVKGLASSGEVMPKGATVKVYNSEGAEVTDIASSVGADGTFVLNFAQAGNYRVEVSGTASYTGQLWDYESGGYTDSEFTSAPVVLSCVDITVLPYVAKTVYVTISTKSGEFAVNKNGDDMWCFPVTASDDADAPDGSVTIMEVLIAAHEQYHIDGAAAFTPASFITKLWGETNGGNCAYYFNDTYMTGSGTKTGSNGRQWQDKLLSTVVEDGDSFSIYSFQASNWSNGDLYTYFYPASVSAVKGVAKTLTVKAGSGYGSNKLETSLVKVYDSTGTELTDLATTVNADGTFTLTFNSSGTYTVDVRTNGTNYVSPSRCMVYVAGGSTSSGSSSSPADSKVYISVKDPNGRTYLNKTGYTISDGETAYSLLIKTGLEVESTSEHQLGGVYIESIEGLGEFSDGATSGWMYKVNGEFPDYSSSLYALSEGDYVEWIYTRSLGEDVGGGSYTGGGSKVNIKEETKEKEPTEDKTTENVKTYPDIAGHWAEDAIKLVSDMEIFTGTDSGFEPETNMTRAMLVTTLFRLDGEKASGKNDFADVPKDIWYTDAVSWAKHSGIVNGTADGFEPDTDVTREQLCTFMYRYAAYCGADIVTKTNLDTFADADKVSDWAQTAMTWAAESGILTGKPGKLLDPKGSATRAEVAAVYQRFIGLIKK